MLALLTFGACCLTIPARADVSSWLSVGGGYAFERNAVIEATDRATVMSLALGVGSSPRASFVLGGTARATTYFSLGTDLGVGPRFATGGFARGDWGAALEAQLIARWWNNGEYGTYPVQGMIYGGAPWGLQLGLGATLAKVGGDQSAQGFLAVLEFDLLRFTVMRRGSTESWWPNPSPAGGQPPGTPYPGTP